MVWQASLLAWPGEVHLPLVSICAIDPVVGVVVWQASLLAWPGEVHLPLVSICAIDPVVGVFHMAGISVCLTRRVHLPLVSRCALDSVAGVVVWQASLLAWPGGPSSFGIYMCNRSSSWCSGMAGISACLTRGGPSTFGIYMCNRSSSWCIHMAGISVCLTRRVHLPLVSRCALDSVAGVVVWQASLLAWPGGPSSFGIYMCNRSSSWCSGMAGIFACLTGGSICLWYLFVQ